METAPLAQAGLPLCHHSTWRALVARPRKMLKMAASTAAAVPRPLAIVRLACLRALASFLSRKLTKTLWLNVPLALQRLNPKEVDEVARGMLVCWPSIVRISCCLTRDFLFLSRALPTPCSTDPFDPVPSRPWRRRRRGARPDLRAVHLCTLGGAPESSAFAHG